jgi:hypothetical protein
MRHPSIRGLGLRYLIAVLLPISGAILVIVTAVELVIAHVTGRVPAPARIVQASLDADYAPPPGQPVAPPSPSALPATSDGDQAAPAPAPIQR